MSKKLIFAWCLLLTLTSSIAQDSTQITNNSTLSLDSLRISPVIVTSSKIPLESRESSKPVTVISRAHLEANKSKNLAQVLNEQVGITVAGAGGNPGQNKSIFLRGATSGYTLILIDGIPVNDPSGIGGAFDIRLIPTNQIDHIEILKGSQSTLYGTDAIAGVINIITKSGSDKLVNFDGTFTYGSFNTRSGQADIHGKFKKNSYLLSYGFLDTEGISEAYDEIDTLDFDKDGMRNQNVAAKVTFNPYNGIQITPFVRASFFDGDYDNGAFADGDNSYESQTFQIGTTGQYTAKKLKVNLNYNEVFSERKFMSAFPSEFKSRMQNIEGFASYDVTKNITLLGGALNQKHIMFDTNSTIVDPDINIYSPYALFIYKDREGFNVEGGARLNAHSKYGNNLTFTFTPSYWVNDQLKVFGGVSSGYKAPTLSQLYGQWGANEDLKPEESLSMELGAGFYHSNEKLQGTVSVFNRSIENVIIYYTDPTTFASSYLNRDEQNDYGVELEARYTPMEKLAVSGGYTYVNGELSTKTDGNEDTSYYNLIRRPKHKFSLIVQYSPIKHLKIAVDAHFIGERSDLFFFFDETTFSFSSREVSLESYVLLNANISYSFLKNSMETFLSVGNILNTDYMEIYGFATRPVNFNLGLSFKL